LLRTALEPCLGAPEAAERERRLIDCRAVFPVPLDADGTIEEDARLLGLPAPAKSSGAALGGCGAPGRGIFMNLLTKVVDVRLSTMILPD
jgi:hypothetical protein